jgi:hypothetical protein
LPGDEGFREFLNLMFEAGKITHRERHQRRLTHDLIVRARPANEAATVAEVEQLVVDDGAA